MPFSAVLLLTLAVAVLNELSAARGEKSNARIAQALLRLEGIADLRALMADVEMGQRGYLLTGEPSYLEPFRVALQDLPAALGRLRELSTNAPQVEAALEQTGAVMAEQLIVASNIVRAYDMTRDRTEAVSLMQAAEGRRLMEGLRGMLATLDALTRAEIDTLEGERIAASRWSRARVLVMTLLALGLLVVLIRQFALAALRQERRRSAAVLEAKALEKLVAARTRELSQLSTHLQEIAEKEKSQLAHDLHDELGGLLTAAKMDLSWLQGSAREPGVKERLEQLGQALDDAMDVKRRVVADLRPSLLEHFGVATAMRAYLQGACRKAGLRCDTRVDDELDTLVPRDVAIALFRIAQEALTNVQRHANAHNVRVELRAEAACYVLRIEDDGTGFDASAPGFSWSHGVNGIRHRVRALGGEFTIDSRRGAGTRLAATIPRSTATVQAPAGGDAHFERASATSGLSSAMSRILSRK